MEIAENTGYPHSWIGQLVRRYNTEAPAVMHTQHLMRSTRD
jgi:hypothetical protein